MSTTTVLERKIGNTSVPGIGFGAMGISAGYGSIEPDEERFKVLDTAFEAGCSFWIPPMCISIQKTSSGNGMNCFAVYPFLYSGRTSKFGITKQGTRGDPEYIKEQYFTSLKRLGVDYIDFYYQHRRGRKSQISRTLRLYHVSRPRNYLPSKLNTRLSFSTSKNPFLELIQTARELGVKIDAYSPLGRGLLTGQFNAENFPKIPSLADRVGDVQEEDTFVIPGTKKIKYLKENLATGSLKLTPKEIAEIRQIAEETEIPGERYGPGFLEMMYIESPALM
ncbi:NADP-dependent oxidoreductase domain-containing protein [Armillaria mellea]|nr:NADP-dependent oxidoreductase domain-containing protein [Armillaria mellea]